MGVKLRLPSDTRVYNRDVMGRQTGEISGKIFCIEGQTTAIYARKSLVAVLLTMMLLLSVAALSSCQSGTSGSSQYGDAIKAAREGIWENINSGEAGSGPRGDTGRRRDSPLRGLWHGRPCHRHAGYHQHHDSVIDSGKVFVPAGDLIELAGSSGDAFTVTATSPAGG